MDYSIETLKPLIQAFIEDLKLNMAEIQRQNAEIEELKQQRIASGNLRANSFAAWQEDMESLWSELRAVQAGAGEAAA